MLLRFLIKEALRHLVLLLSPSKLKDATEDLPEVTVILLDNFNLLKLFKS